MEKVITYGDYGDSDGLEIRIKGDAVDHKELKIKAIESLISSVNLKHTFNADTKTFNEFVERVLLAATDVIGYETFYWDHTPDEEKSYNEHDELVVSKKAKLELLEIILNDMKKMSETKN